MKGQGKLRSRENGQKSRQSERSKWRGLITEMNILKIKGFLGFKVIIKDLRERGAWLVWVCEKKVHHGLRRMFKLGCGNP